ncbi:pimeloyl-ACP methyl ester carboxylesterase [Actinomycetospora succinea]|uniref:Pimeloyl-ACP methyl ester carboxylesterase n=1 Tax=Actinomycetospora succinea TaxID=663603 RepID=A0A4R6VRU7_9PSEU|nr:alpha/beta hydrolase [Actinomycetospora succinea]TDQ65190.1 pimeloyl-ACP methyl ester carboxylesterase [Actinomycetospora succinea]
MDVTEFEARRASVDTPSGQIGYVETGDPNAPVALFVHGVIVNSYLWRHQLDDLSDLRRCVAVDLLGHGHSVARGPDHSFTAQARMLAEFLDALGIDQVDLIANDSGTGIAQLFAVAEPGRVRTLALTNGDVHDNWPPADFAGFVEMVRDGGLAATVQAMVDDPDRYRAPDGLGGAYSRPEKIDDSTVEAYLLPYLDRTDTVAGLEAFILGFDPAQTVAVENELKALDVPTLVVWGTGDIFFDVGWSHWLAETLPQVRRRAEILGAHLLLPEEYPGDLNAELREHLTA